MIDTTKIAIRASTQTHLDIEDIKDSIVVLKDGSCCLVLSVTAINFGLLSEREQDATIYSYAGLLNSLSFSIQILVRSARKDISGYLKLLETAERKETRTLIKNQIAKYRRFVAETVQKNDVLDKKFYLAIPMSSLELGIAKTLGATMGAPKRKGLPFEKSYILERGKINLYPKRDHVLRQLARLGLKGRQLNSQELIRLFFDIYNPESGSAQIVEPAQYQTPLVQPGLPPAPLADEAPAEEVPITNEPVSPAQRGEPETIQDQINHLVTNSDK